VKNLFLRFIFVVSILLSPLLLAKGLPGSATALVVVHPEKPGLEIPADFLGLSYEKLILAENYFRPDNSELVNLCRNLGGGVLRFGGNKVETTSWSRVETVAAKTHSKNASQTIGPADLDNLYAFSKQSGWRVIHGLNLGGRDPAMAADEAAYALQVGGSSVVAFEVGNEPDYYPKHELRPASYDYSQYRNEAVAEQRAILEKSPQALLAGPATTRHCLWFNNFLADFKGRIALTTSHFYSLSSKSKDPRSPNFASIENLLSASTKQAWIATIAERQKSAHASGIPFRLGECNSVSDGGTDGVSDAFVSALWGADFLFDVAEQGVAGINFHGGFGGHGYTPLSFHAGHYRPHPLYYGMLLFHQAAGGRMVPVECKTTANVTAHAVLGDDGKLHVVLINKSFTQTVAVSVAPGAMHAKAEVMRLTAPSVVSKEGVTFGGSPVRMDGKWTPPSGEMVACLNGRFELSVPAASAAMLTIE
jgi:Glycosyl hydrolase family 79 C-terminal beta domain